MKHRTAFALTLALGLTSVAAHAQERPTRAAGAYAGGIVLTSIGSLFLTGGAVLGGAVLAVGSSGTDGDGMGGLMLAVDGLIAVGMTVVGLATFIPGIVLVVKNHPGKFEQPLRDAHAAPPAPRFVSVPILTGTF
ncbi:MAG TPA: hypothetical protein VGH28_12725 [Polyangiaceae bacterium]|jgi:hypothetical protein